MGGPLPSPLSRLPVGGQGDFGFGLSGFGGVGEALDEGAVLTNACFGLVHSDEGVALVQVRGGDLGVVGVVLEDVVVVLNGSGVLAPAEVHFADVVVGVAGEVVVRVGLDEVLELGGGERVLPGHVVAVGSAVHLRGGRAGGVGWRSGGCGLAVVSERA